LADVSERCIKVVWGPYLGRIEPEAEDTGGPLGVVNRFLVNIGRVESRFHEKGSPRGAWQKLLQ
jgi:hypothetical protein